MPRRLVRKQVLTAAASWLLGAALFAATEPLWQAAGFFVFLLTPLAALAAYSLAAERRRARRPAGFTVTAGSFTCRPWRPIAAMFLTAGHLAGPKLVASASASGALDVVLSLFLAATFSMLFVIGAVVTPRLVLSPTGLECRGGRVSRSELGRHRRRLTRRGLAAGRPGRAADLDRPERPAADRDDPPRVRSRLPVPDRGDPALHRAS
ncbi:hypothetical protein [Catellatospora bangladeshensis]|uniref:hypothetical protein n=1 Tax=Catellatospora bangladeshensis TaxID=310355 RepID=UPI0019431949|nr:hypothetical protein [Catellatospora bangladeshensis]